MTTALSGVLSGVRSRMLLLGAIVVLALASAGGYVAYAHSRQAAMRGGGPGGPGRPGAPLGSVSLTSAESGPHLVFRDTARGSGYGYLAVVPLSDPDGPRALTQASCDRAYASRAGTLCLSADRGLVTSYHTFIYTVDWRLRAETPLAGLPSRARLSPDGSLAATTTFVYGDSYTNPGQFSTRTLVGRVDGGTIADLEQFTLVIDGHEVSAADRNLWGVTFADDDTFYATAATGGHTWLVRGSLAKRLLVSLRPDVECPSLSPDGTRVAFKQRGDLPPGKWRLAVYDLRTGRQTQLAERRSVDDQVEWLNNESVLYGLPRGTGASATQDVWVVPADGGGTPVVFVHDAWSPSVVR